MSMDSLFKSGKWEEINEMVRNTPETSIKLLEKDEDYEREGGKFLKFGIVKMKKSEGNSTIDYKAGNKLLVLNPNI